MVSIFINYYWITISIFFLFSHVFSSFVFYIRTEPLPNNNLNYIMRNLITFFFLCHLSISPQYHFQNIQISSYSKNHPCSLDYHKQSLQSQLNRIETLYKLFLYFLLVLLLNEYKTSKML